MMVPLFKGLAFGTSGGDQTSYKVPEWEVYNNVQALESIDPELSEHSIILIRHGHAYTLWSLNELNENKQTFIQSNLPSTGVAQNATITGWISGENENLELKQPGQIDGTVKVEIFKNKVTFNGKKAFSKVWIAELTEEATTTTTYTVLWVDEDGTELEKDDNVAYGATPSYDGTEPSKVNTAQYTYDFTGWTPTISTVTDDITYTATYSATTNTYTVLWVDEDLTQIQKAEPEAAGETASNDGTETEEMRAEQGGGG